MQKDYCSSSCLLLRLVPAASASVFGSCCTAGQGTCHMQQLLHCWDLNVNEVASGKQSAGGGGFTLLYACLLANMLFYGCRWHPQFFFSQACFTFLPHNLFASHPLFNSFYCKTAAKVCKLKFNAALNLLECFVA